MPTDGMSEYDKKEYAKWNKQGVNAVTDRSTHPALSALGARDWHDAVISTHQSAQLKEYNGRPAVSDSGPITTFAYSIEQGALCPACLHITHSIKEDLSW